MKDKALEEICWLYVAAHKEYRRWRRHELALQKMNLELMPDEESEMRYWAGRRNTFREVIRIVTCGGYKRGKKHWR